MSSNYKNRLLVIINIILFLSFIIQIITVILFITGMAGEIAYKLHGMAGISLLFLASIHIILNFSWIRSKFAALTRKNS